MPIIKSAKKAARQAVKRRAQNTQIKKDIKAALKNFKANPTAENMSKVQSEYDKAAKKGLIKKNTASRRKMALAKFAKENGVKLVKKAAKPAATTKKTATTKKAATPKKTTKATETAKATTKATTAKKPAAKKPAAKAKAEKKAA